VVATAETKEGGTVFEAGVRRSSGADVHHVRHMREELPQGAITIKYGPVVDEGAAISAASAPRCSSPIITISSYPANRGRKRKVKYLDGFIERGP
jgi:hypothetical protein